MSDSDRPPDVPERTTPPTDETPGATPDPLGAAGETAPTIQPTPMAPSDTPVEPPAPPSSDAHAQERTAEAIARPANEDIADVDEAIADEAVPAADEPATARAASNLNAPAEVNEETATQDASPRTDEAARDTVSAHPRSAPAASQPWLSGLALWGQDAGTASRAGSSWAARLRPELPIMLIVLIAAALRVFGYDWDEGTQLHPDERAIAGALHNLGLPNGWSQFWSPSSPLNPHFSAYGHLPFYATVLFGHFLSFWGHLIGGPLAGLAQADAPGAGIIESGRVLSGLADAGTLVFIYLIARLVYGRSTGLVAALLGCFTVLDLEFSHFANVDTFLAFCVTGALYFCVRVSRLGRPRDYLWAGAWIGFAIACKISAAPLIVPLIVAHIYRGSERTASDPDTLPATPSRPQSPSVAMRPVPCGRTDPPVAAATAGPAEQSQAEPVPAMRRQSQASVSPAPRHKLPSDPLLLLLALAAMGVAVFVTMPYAFIDFNGWWSDVSYQLQLAQGIQEQAFTRKFSGLPKYYYELQQLIGWTMGLPLGLSAVAGVLVALGRQVRRRRGVEMVLLSWVVIFVASAAGQYMKYLRYMLPLSPILTLFAAALLVWLWRWARTRRSVLPRVGARAVVVAVIGLTILYGLAYEHVYTVENTRLAATRWMAAHIPAGAPITVEDWDESLPWAPPGLAVPSYQSQQLSILGPGDSASTVPMFVNALQTANYITISSARVFGSVAHQPGRYPYSIRWYDLLFANKLNFRLAASFTSPPQLGPIRINDYQAPPRAGYYDHLHLWYEADQNMTEYNAPPVYIFKRVGTIDPARATALLTHDDHGHLLAPAVAAYDPKYSMLLPRKVEQADQKAPTYSSIFPANNPLAKAPLLSWLVMVELLGLLALPLVLRACRGLLRDGGYALAKLCGIVIVGYLTWIAASLHVATYSRGLILISCLILLVASLALGLRPRALWAELRARRKGILWVEGVFLVAFLAMTLVRMAYPDLWHLYYGGERTQELSFMNAILRSQYFPPADPWFAGGTLNYYYYGQYLTGMLMKLAGIPVPVAFNLALPTLYALLLSIAFSIGFNASGRAWVGAAAAALEGVLGNLGPVQQLAALSPTHVGVDIPVISGLIDAFGGFIAVLTRQAQLPGDFFWTSSRILSTPNGIAINEYPIWSYTYGDMHAHVIDMPILLGVVLLALAASGLGIARTMRPQSPSAAMRPQSQANSSPEARVPWPQLWLLGALMVVVAGATGPTNLWDLPTALGLLVAGFALRGWFVAGRRGWALTLRDLVLPGAVLGLLCLVLYRPFYSSVNGLTSGFTFLTPTTPADKYLMHFGLPIFLLTSFWVFFLLTRVRLAYWARRGLTVLEFEQFYADQAARLPRLFGTAAAMMRRARPQVAPPCVLSLHVALFGPLLALALAVMGYSTPALVAALLTLGTIALVEALARSRYLDVLESQPFALSLAVIGLALSVIPEFVMQNEAGRMNTSFKLYNQAWPLLAVSGALALSALLRPRRAEAPARATQPATPLREPAPTLALAPAVAGSSGAWTPRLFSTRAPDDMTARPEIDAPRPAPSSDDAAQEATTPADEATAPAEETAEGATALAPEGEIEGEDATAPTMEAHGVEAAPAPVARRVAPRPRTGQSWNWRWLWWAALAVLTWGAFIFPTFGVYNHLQIRSQWAQAAAAHVPDGLDGAAFVRKMYPADWAAIQWINGHITGMPVLLTSERGYYIDFAAKVTMFTGLPTVISWDWEDAQERYSGQSRPASNFPSAWINQLDSGRVTWNGTQWVTNLPPYGAPAAGSRSSDVETIYNTTDTSQALTLLREYHVSYIYVGTAERGDPASADYEMQHYGHSGFDPAGLAKFDTMAAQGTLRVVYDKLGVKIYKVV